MGRELQKKKSRSSIPKTRATLRGRTKHGKKKVNFLGNAVIAENWDRDQTLLQNYRRLGLTSRLGAATGGTEKKISHTQPDTLNAENRAPREEVDALAIPSNKTTTKLIPTEARVERDPETGRILRVIHPESANSDQDTRRKRRRLHDPLNSDSGSESATEMPTLPDASHSMPSTGVVAALEAQAEEEAAQLARKKRPRQQSKREEEWIEALVGKYGDDTAAMARDRRLNPMQQTEADIGRRIRKWRNSTSRMEPSVV